MTTDTPDGVDLEMFQDMKELMEEDFPLLLETYLDDTPLLLEQINSANSTGNPQGLTAPAHQLKSTSASLGFTTLEALASQLEDIGNGADSSEAVALCEQVNTNYAQLTPFLTTHLE